MELRKKLRMNIAGWESRRNNIQFCYAVVQSFGLQFLCSPTNANLHRLKASFCRADFPGCIGCLDCEGLQWHMYPKDMQDTYIGEEGKFILRLEAIFDLQICVWNIQFGMHGMLNDFNILDPSRRIITLYCGV